MTESQKLTDPLTNDWRKKDNEMRDFIYLFLDDAQIVHVKSQTIIRET